MQGEFDHFTPEQFLPDVEKLLGAGLTGYACAFTSYVNRVYELETTSGDRLVAKFYRPGRWTPEAILDEHDFVFDCADREVNVVAPYELTNGSTLGFPAEYRLRSILKNAGAKRSLKQGNHCIKSGRFSASSTPQGHSIRRSTA